MRTNVVIVGGGPSGLLLSQLLHLQGIKSIVLEHRSRDHVLGRIRAGVLEQGTVDLLIKAGMGDQIARHGAVHPTVGIAHENEWHHIPIAELTDGKTVTVFGQTEVTKGLYAIRDAVGGQTFHNVEDVDINGIDSDTPSVSFRIDKELVQVDCDFVAGCDGFHGVSRSAMPADLRQEHHLQYPFGWLGVMSETPPVADEVVYIHHADGFALCSMRSPELSRYYIQVPASETIGEWSDDRFWETLKHRMPSELSANLVTGKSIEKSIAPLRAFVYGRLSWNRLFLAGDAGHIVPPTGAKGLNLAFSDVHYLSTALTRFYRQQDETALQRYSDIALRRVWGTVRFSLQCTRMLHRFPQQTAFENQIQLSELAHLTGNSSASRVFAECYVGLPFDPI
ncbi:MAG: 4-hydroxybenzoate 3-monooxygenase [Pseudomonadota bacterium]